MDPIRTARLLLRPLSEADIDALASYWSRDDVCRWLPYEPRERAEIAEMFRDGFGASTLAEEGDRLSLGVELPGTGLIGDVMLVLRSAEHRSGELGWVFHPDHGGHGYATEAAGALLRLAFDRFDQHRVVARVFADNDASRRLCGRLGMRQEAHLVENEWYKGEWTDEVVFALLEREWRAR